MNSINLIFRHVRVSGTSESFANTLYFWFSPLFPSQSCCCCICVLQKAHGFPVRAAGGLVGFYCAQYFIPAIFHVWKNAPVQVLALQRALGRGELSL